MTKLFYSAGSEIVLYVPSSIIIFFLQEYTKFLKLISMTTSCKYYVVILCLQFCGIGTGDVKAFNCVDAIQEIGMREIVSDCFSPPD